jgi:Cys-tRNA(Pro) deacylase
MPTGQEEFRRKAKSLGLKLEIVSLPQSTRTAAEAAQAVGCQLGQIAKSIVFQSKKGNPVLVIASGANRIDEEKLEKILGEKIQKADADFVRQETGFVIGGVSPFGHKKKIITFIDKDLFNFSEIWAAAGDSFSVFKTTASELAKITAGQVIEVK